MRMMDDKCEKTSWYVKRCQTCYITNVQVIRAFSIHLKLPLGNIARRGSLPVSFFCSSLKMPLPSAERRLYFPHEAAALTSIRSLRRPLGAYLPNRKSQRKFASRSNVQTLRRTEKKITDGLPAAAAVEICAGLGKRTSHETGELS